MRRCSSSKRSWLRATSMPPESIERFMSRYWLALCSPSNAISLLWSTGKMKFDACPVEPPGLGRGPFSMRTRSCQPSRARCPTRQLPTIPAPITTTLALVGNSLTVGLYSEVDCRAGGTAEVAARSLRYNPRRQYWTIVQFARDQSFRDSLFSAHSCAKEILCA